MGQQWPAAGAGALGTADLGMAQALLEEVAINPTIRSHQNLHRTGETDTWRTQTKPCVRQDPGERSSDPKETDPDLPVSIQESLVEVWVGSSLLQVQPTECSSVCMGPF